MATTEEVHAGSLFFLQASSGWHRVHESPAGQGERRPADCQGRLPHTCGDQEAQGAGEGQRDRAGKRWSEVQQVTWGRVKYEGTMSSFIWHWKRKAEYALTFLSAICCCINLTASCFWILIMLLKWRFISCSFKQDFILNFILIWGRLCICVKGWVPRHVISSILKVCSVWRRLRLMLA